MNRVKENKSGINLRFQNLEDRFLRDIDFDISLLVGWVEDTYTPSFNILRLKVAIREMLQDVHNHEEKRGESSKSKESKNKFDKMLDLCESLDKVAMQNNTFQLIVKHSLLEMQHKDQEIYALKQEIEKINKAWNLM